jgi:hypothetical protein
VVDRAHFQRELYKKAKDSNTASVHRAWRKYWNSQVPLEAYEGGHSIPEICIFNTIEFGRLNVEWSRKKEDVRKYFFRE